MRIVGPCRVCLQMRKLDNVRKGLNPGLWSDSSSITSSESMSMTRSSESSDAGDDSGSGGGNGGTAAETLGSSGRVLFLFRFRRHSGGVVDSMCSIQISESGKHVAARAGAAGCGCVLAGSVHNLPGHV